VLKDAARGAKEGLRKTASELKDLGQELKG
jgi:hypothetical protein